MRVHLFFAGSRADVDTLDWR